MGYIELTAPVTHVWYLKGVPNYLSIILRCFDEDLSVSKIEQVFYKVYKEPISVRFLRMSWISALMKTNPTNKEMKELAREMAHSKEEQSKYNKILRN
jgi:DNA-directed RNA polymerase beta' subunit